MKLKRITIHNIASIADAEIDFVASPLADTPLFLIAGPTGAGKSIILDSVCLALYARAPRLTRFKTDEKYEDSTLVGVEKEDDRNVGVDANRQLMRRSTVECFAKLRATMATTMRRSGIYIGRETKPPANSRKRNGL